MRTIIRALNRATFRAIHNHTPIDQLLVPVFYGTNDYRDDVAHICEIVGHIRNELPECSARDMTVHKLLPSESDKIAHHTGVIVMVDVRLVRENFDKFISY